MNAAFIIRVTRMTVWAAPGVAIRHRRDNLELLIRQIDVLSASSSGVMA